MHFRHSLLPAALLAALATLAPGAAEATNGYFAHGYGVKSQGIAGIGIALPQDGLAAASNPAGTAFVGDRADVGISLFRPDRGAEISGNRIGFNGDYSGNDTRNFFIPEGGYVRQLSPQWSAGVAVYGNGGMNTDYGSNPFRAIGASGNAGVNLEQLFISPSLAYKPAPGHAVGAALNFAYQRFSAKGIQPFAGFSANGGNLSNQGTDSSTGWGVRLGYTGQVTPDLTLGLTWASKVKTSSFDKYKGLFAEGGGFDIPGNYGLGLAYKATPALTLAADVQRIEYSKVKSIGNAIDQLFTGNIFGTANGPGFGWKDVTVVKLGASYQLNPGLTVRGGISHVSDPIPANQTFLNVLAPGVVRDHLTLGATWQHGNSGELSVSYGHAFKTTIKGNGSIPGGTPPAGFGGGEANIRLEENILGVAYGWKL